MVLKRNVTDRSGRLLLPEGATLEARHLGIFRMWGVLEAEVTDECEPEGAGEELEAEQVDPELLARAMAEVEVLFAHNDLEHPAIHALVRICTKRRTGHAV